MTDENNYKSKFEAAKELVKQLDRKVAKYESIDLDEMMDTLQEYESLGTVDELRNKLKSESSEGGSDKMEKEDLEKQLKAYQEIGTIEELEELMSKYKESKINEKNLEAENKSDKDKLESLIQEHDILLDKLESYVSIGSIGELNDLIEDYSTMKSESEARRISQELDISYDKVVSTIDKMESVVEAEELLREIFKNESHNESTKYSRNKSESAEYLGSSTTSDRTNRLRELMKRV